jgi:hydrogenase expression/formation protein HypD
MDSFRDPRLSRLFLKKISELKPEGINLMEVCGTHTVNISRFGIRRALPRGLRVVSGPGCPVCVTSDSDLFKSFQVLEKDATLSTFGDMVKVPLKRKTLLNLKAEGKDIRVVYSPFDTVNFLSNGKEVVFFGVGFETTSPTVAALLDYAVEHNIKNFSIISSFKLIPPALKALLSSKESKIDGLILPGHVSTIIGTKPYEFIVKDYGIPSVITGFEPVDILASIYLLIKMIKNKRPMLINAYPRSVRPEGNRKAQGLLYKYFEVSDASWRGFGYLKESGLKLKDSFKDYDAELKLGIKPENISEPPGCRCADVVRGMITPPECPLYGKICTPENPIGPCMVTSEGACAAYYNYGG